MRSPGFQWFVAWRYLMARPRRVSGIILVFAAVFAGVAGGIGYATALDPLTDEFIAASEPLPAWLTVGFGMALSLSIVLLLHAVIRLGAGPSPRRSPFFAALAGLAGLAQLAAASVLAAGEPGEPAGLLDLPGLRDQSPAWLSPPVLLALAATAAAIFASLAIKREPERSLARRVVLVAAATIPVALAHVYWWRMVDFARIELGGAGGAVSHHPPVVLTIVGGVAVALCTLSLVMLAIRYLFTFFTTVSMGGVAIGTMALVVTLSVMSGFESDLRKKILGSNAHVLITRHDEAPFTGYARIMDVAADVPGVVAETPYLTSEVVIAGSSNYFNVVIKGVDPRSIARVTDLADDLDDEQALDRMFPLADDGGVVGPPPDAGPSEAAPDRPPVRPDVTDPAPEDLDVDQVPPTDWSGGATGAEAPAAEAPAGPDRDRPAGPDRAPIAAVDPAPPDLDTTAGAPTDWSGGLRAAPPPDAGPPPGAARRDPLIAGEDLADAPPEPADRDRPDHRPTLDDEDWLPPPARELEPAIAALPGVLVGRELVKQINLYEGQEVKVISPLGQNTVIGETPYIKPYRVAGVFFTGMYEFDLKRVYVELGTLQDFLDLPDAVTGIEIRVRDPEDTDTVIAALRAKLGTDYMVQDWKELNRSLFSALKLEKIAMFLVLAIIILVASFSIVGNLIMVVIEKAREIAVLKTLGASDAGVTRIFIVQGFFIGLVGTIIGMILGLSACFLAERYGVNIPPDVYYIDRLPVHVESNAVLLVAAAGLLISVGATIYPAQIASRLRPVQGLRYE